MPFLGKCDADALGLPVGCRPSARRSLGESILRAFARKTGADLGIYGFCTVHVGPPSIVQNLTRRQRMTCDDRSASAVCKTAQDRRFLRFCTPSLKKAGKNVSATARGTWLQHQARVAPGWPASTAN